MTTEKNPEDGQSPQSDSGATRPATGRRRTQPAAKAKPKAKPVGDRGRRAGSKTGKSQTTTAKSSRQGTSRRQSTAKTADKAAPEEAPRVQPRPLPRLLTRFRDEIRPALMQEFGFVSPMRVPRLSKIVLNIGLGEAIENAKAMESATGDLSLISGQRPVVTRARKSIAGFKLREGMAIGLSVTLRSRRMYEFFDRLFSSALPRIRDFRGLSREAFDGRGNYSVGITEQIIFPEIDYNSIDRIRGLQVAIVTTARTDQEGLRLLELLGVPFTRPETASTAA